MLGVLGYKQIESVHDTMYSSLYSHYPGDSAFSKVFSLVLRYGNYAITYDIISRRGNTVSDNTIL